ncbi:UDP-glycosyltransferase UGT5-like [Colias croceus]|uniref:UDP-glycosyltransferase UGT5-like n=1 Tax=Colias crocea TaxID=72248 RepID=UPI001E27C0F1|nr:UDP-glycosyltransferase UGT5-like [Colias croceus]
MELLKLLILAVLLINSSAYKILVVVSLPGKSHGILGEGIVRHLINAGHENLLKDTNQTFDVLLIEYTYQDLNAGFSAVYDCPYIWFSPLEPHWMVLRLIDELPNPAYVSDSASNNAPPLNFKERVKELFNQINGILLKKYYIESLENKYYDTYIVPHVRSRNRPVPSLTELKYNASLMLGNSHASLGEATRLPQSYKPIGGYHIEKNVKPLPDNLKKLMDNAEHGVIYFSMGSNLRSDTLPEKTIQNLLKIFGELKQTVIWKFERDLPKRPKNVHNTHWAPQQGILAHPNCLFFISHGGLLSTTEAVHFGIPMIIIPGMADQYVNADRAVRKGFAIQVDLSFSMDVDLNRAIQEMLTEPKYKVKAKEVSLIYHDRPVSPEVELVHWVEHVVRTQGAPLLRSPALMMPWYQKCYLDLFAILVVFTAIVLILKTICKMGSRKSYYNKKNK